MDYGQIVTKAFRTIWRYKYLWWLGLLATFAGEGGVGFPNPSGLEDLKGAEFREVTDWIAANLALLISLAVVVGLIMLVLFFIGVIAKGGLIAAVNKIQRGEPTWFGDGFRAGVAAFWRMLGVTLAISLPLVILFGGLAGGGYLLLDGEQYTAAVILLLVAFLPCLILLAYAQLLYNYATRFAVLQGLGSFASISQAHGMMMRCKGESLVIWLIYLGLAIGIQMALGVAMILMLIPIIVIFGTAFAAAGLGGLTGGSTGASGLFGALGAGLIVLIIFVIIVGLVAIMLGGIVAAFNSSFWTFAFLELLARAFPPTQVLPEEPQIGGVPA